jgi:hypothetical protein
MWQIEKDIIGEVMSVENPDWPRIYRGCERSRI